MMDYEKLAGQLHANVDTEYDNIEKSKAEIKDLNSKITLVERILHLEMKNEELNEKLDKSETDGVTKSSRILDRVPIDLLVAGQAYQNVIAYDSEGNGVFGSVEWYSDDGWDCYNFGEKRMKVAGIYEVCFLGQDYPTKSDD